MYLIVSYRSVLMVTYHLGQVKIIVVLSSSTQIHLIPILLPHIGPIMTSLQEVCLFDHHCCHGIIVTMTSLGFLTQ